MLAANGYAKLLNQVLVLDDDKNLIWYYLFSFFVCFKEVRKYRNIVLVFTVFSIVWSVNALCACFFVVCFYLVA